MVWVVGASEILEADKWRSPFPSAPKKRVVRTKVKGITNVKKQPSDEVFERSLWDLKKFFEVQMKNVNSLVKDDIGVAEVRQVAARPGRKNLLAGRCSLPRIFDTIWACLEEKVPFIFILPVDLLQAEAMQKMLGPVQNKVVFIMPRQMALSHAGFVYFGWDLDRFGLRHQVYWLPRVGFGSFTYGEVKTVEKNDKKGPRKKEDRGKDNKRGQEKNTATSKGKNKSEKYKGQGVSHAGDSHAGHKVSDILDVTVHPAPVISLLTIRLEDSLACTWMDPNLISLNPFKWSLADNSKDVRDARKMVPDVVALAEMAISQLSSGRPQRQLMCFHIHGESGLGKTEQDLKSALAYLALHSLGTRGADLSAEQRHIEHSLIHTNAVLESFGNAATVRNANVSRFAKTVKAEYVAKDKKSEFEIAGVSMNTFMLELRQFTNQVRVIIIFHQRMIRTCRHIYDAVVFPVAIIL